MSVIKIKKRNNNFEQLDLAKIHKVLEWATDGISNVSVSEIELRAELQFYDTMTTEEIQETLIRSAADLISEETPNYQYVAARLISFDLRKRVYNDYNPWPLKQIVEKNIGLGVYTSDLLNWYNDDEWKELDKIVKHDRDDKFTYVGIEQLRQKYLAKNKYTKEIFETPQTAFILIAATIFHRYPKETRMTWVKDFYNALSNFDISLPTPIMAGVRTSFKQYSSCTLIDVDDSLDSINAAASAIVKYAAARAGIGFNVGRIRAVGSKIRGGDTLHTGMIPFIKYFNSALKAVNQGGIRSASATCFFEFWHYEFEDMIVLKNNKGTEDTRVRSIDYGVQLNRLAYQRLIDGGNITFFSPSDVPGLYEAFVSDQDEFERLYVQYENDPSIRKKSMPAFDMFTSIMTERKETGRIYIMNIDHANTYGYLDPSQAPIQTSNLCLEILQHVKPMKNVEDPDGIVGLCTLSAINIGNIKTPSDFERPARLLVRALNEILDYQEYPLPAAKNSVDKFRNLGIGLINLAYFLAKHNYKYDSPDVLEWLQPFIEAYSYYIIRESMLLAKETGPCEWTEKTKYKQGILPGMNYKKEFDEWVADSKLLDWNKLAEDCATYGTKNASLMAIMPSETSAQVSNSTNGIEPPRSLVSIKNSKDGALKQVVPEMYRLKKKYDLLWDQKSPNGYLAICGLISKYIDQAVSTNTSYNPENYEGNDIPMSVLLGDLLETYKMGIPTLYYLNTKDGSGEIDIEKIIQKEETVLSEELDFDEACEACVI